MNQNSNQHLEKWNLVTNAKLFLPDAFLCNKYQNGFSGLITAEFRNNSLKIGGKDIVLIISPIVKFKGVS